MDSRAIRLIIPIAVAIVFAIARRYLPLSGVRVQPRTGTVDEVDSAVAAKQWIVTLSMVLVGGLFLFGVHAALVQTSRWLASRDGAAELVIFPQAAIWWFLPGFGAAALPWEITLLAMSLLRRDAEADSYNYWSSLKEGFDSRRLLRWLAVVVVMPIAVLTFLALPMRSALRQDDIQDCGYAFATCKVYAYADARRVSFIEGTRDRDGKLNRRAGLVVDFTGGRRWSSADIGEFNASVDPALEGVLREKIKLPFGRYQTVSDIPPLAAESR
jgi:hypothetical protein